MFDDGAEDVEDEVEVREENEDTEFYGVESDSDDENNEEDKHDNEECKDVYNTNIPKLALVNGTFRGKVPDCLIDLWDTEVSLISIINPISKIAVQNKYAESKAKVFSVFNNVQKIADKLPRMMSVESFAYLRSASNSKKLYKFRPRTVMNALWWLKANNCLYNKVDICEPIEWEKYINENEEIDIHSSIIDDEEIDAIENMDYNHEEENKEEKSNDNNEIKRTCYNNEVDTNTG